MIPKPYNARLCMYEIKSSLTLLHGIIHKADDIRPSILNSGKRNIRGIPPHFKLIRILRKRIRIIEQYIIIREQSIRPDLFHQPLLVSIQNGMITVILNRLQKGFCNLASLIYGKSICSRGIIRYFLHNKRNRITDRIGL